MYYPYIRAKQYDLAALTELDPNLFSHETVIPIVEPTAAIKIPQYRKLADKKIPFFLVVNPIVGPLKSLTPEKSIIDNLVNNCFKDYQNYWLAYIIQPNTTIDQVKQFIKSYPKHYHAFIHFHKFKDVAKLADLISSDFNAQYNIFIENRIGMDYINQFSKIDAYDILIKDSFTKRERNADYPEYDYFSDLHKIFNKDLGYDGFGDFTIIGSSFDEGGGPAYVVALHLTDLDKEGNLIVNHFLSDTTEPLTSVDPGGKFSVALRKLKKYIDNELTQDTAGSHEYLALHRTGHYPGLGIPKKLSIMHHIELIHSLL